MVRSIGDAAPHFDALSVNPVHIQNGTVVEWLFHRGRYRPPWLWSVVEALQEGATLRGTSRLVSFPTAGGLARGPHNCGKCDARVLEAIEASSLAQEFGPLDDLDCACRERMAGGSRARAPRGRSVIDLVPHLPPHAESTIRQFLSAHAPAPAREGVVVGLSGGIDSALCARLAADALGPEHVLGVLLPADGFPEELRAETVRYAERLGIAHRTVSLDRTSRGVSDDPSGRDGPHHGAGTRSLGSA